uniref:Cell surface glycoprotein 1 n=1 Tax=Talaromyces marneffei PM1 TaxID=1077442 RepID=A0A093VUM0_TALMA
MHGRLAYVERFTILQQSSEGTNPMSVFLRYRSNPLEYVLDGPLGIERMHSCGCLRLQVTENSSSDSASGVGSCVLLNVDSSFAELSEDMIAHGYVRTVPELDEEIGYPKRHVETPKGRKRRKLITPSIEEPVAANELIHTDEPVPSEEPVLSEERIPTEEAIAAWPIEQPVETGAVSELPDRNCFCHSVT